MRRAPSEPPAARGTTLTLDDLRQVLSEAIRDLRAGTANPASVNALSNATGKILSSVKLEMEYAKATGRRPHIGLMKDIDAADTNSLPPPAGHDSRTR